MSLLGFIKKPLGKFLGIQEPPRPKLAINEKSKTNIALPFVVGSDYVKLEGASIFKRQNEGANQVGIALAWCVGPMLNANADATLYVGNRTGKSSEFKFNPGTEEASILAWVTPSGGPNGYNTDWTDFKSLFNWGNDLLGKGICFSLIKYHQDTKVFENDPTNDFWLKARRNNLRRVDGQANGISDSLANNPFAVIKWYINDSVVGMDKDLSLIGDSFQDSIDWVENNLVTQNGIDRKRFTMNGVVSTEKEFKEVLELFELHCHSKINFIQGKFEITTKGRTSTPFLDFNDSNIVGKVESVPSSAQDKKTQFITRFINPDKNWEEDQAIYPETDSAEHVAALEANNYIEEIGEDLLSLCNNYFEAYENSRIKFRESQDLVTVKLTAHAEASQLVQYDVVSITDAKRGWNAKLFLVEKIEEKESSGVETYMLTLTGYNPTTYAWSGNGAYTPQVPYLPQTQKIPAPTNLQWNNNFRQLSWSAPSTSLQVQEYSVYVNNQFYTSTRNNYTTLDLPNPGASVTNTVNIAIIPEGIFGPGESLISTILVVDAVTPDYTPVVRPGSILIKPDTPPNQSGFYEFRHGTEDNITLSAEASSGPDFTLFTAQAGQTVYFWVRVVVNGVFGDWLKKTAVTQAPDSFIWKVYADDEAGTNISLTNTGQALIGLAFFQSVEFPDLAQMATNNDYSAFEAWVPNSAERFIYGSGIPSNAIGNVGDSYVNTVNNDVYTKTGSGWVLTANFGSGDGDGFFSGTSDPLNTFGNDGNTYLNLTSKELFKKINGSWVSQGIINGEDGQPGDPGAPGENAEYVTHEISGPTSWSISSNGTVTPSRATTATLIGKAFSGGTVIGTRTLTVSIATGDLITVSTGPTTGTPPSVDLGTFAASRTIIFSRNGSSSAAVFFVVKDGDTGPLPELNTDYFVAGGNFVSIIFRNATSRPATPTGGTFDGTNETFPTSWTDDPSDYTPPSKRWFSVRQYQRNPSDGFYSAVGGWSIPALQGETGPEGPEGPDGPQGPIGPPGADSPQANVVRDSDVRTFGSEGITKLALATNPTNQTSKITFGISGTANAFQVEGGDNLTATPIPIRVRMLMYRNGALFSTRPWMSSSTTLNYTQTHEIPVAGTAGSYETAIEVDVQGVFNNLTVFVDSYMQIEKL